MLPSSATLVRYVTVFYSSDGSLESEPQANRHPERFRFIEDSGGIT